MFQRLLVDVLSSLSVAPRLCIKIFMELLHHSTYGALKQLYLWPNDKSSRDTIDFSAMVEDVLRRSSEPRLARIGIGISDSFYLQLLEYVKHVENQSV